MRPCDLINSEFIGNSIQARICHLTTTLLESKLRTIIILPLNRTKTASAILIIYVSLLEHKYVAARARLLTKNEEVGTEFEFVHLWISLRFPWFFVGIRWRHALHLSDINLQWLTLALVFVLGSKSIAAYLLILFPHLVDPVQPVVYQWFAENMVAFVGVFLKVLF